MLLGQNGVFSFFFSAVHPLAFSCWLQGVVQDSVLLHPGEPSLSCGPFSSFFLSWTTSDPGHSILVPFPGHTLALECFFPPFYFCALAIWLFQLFPRLFWWFASTLFFGTRSWERSASSRFLLALTAASRWFPRRPPLSLNFFDLEHEMNGQCFFPHVGQPQEPFFLFSAIYWIISLFL